MKDKCPCCKKTNKQYKKESYTEEELFQEIQGTFLIEDGGHYHPHTAKISLYGCNNCGVVVFK